MSGFEIHKVIGVNQMLFSVKKRRNYRDYKEPKQIQRNN